ncbi:MAG: hypothetical protein JNJ88_07120 [Planctomycetes bacterium]|nr:hypothetical protein [Planctomycetota bacterium]
MQRSTLLSFLFLLLGLLAFSAATGLASIFWTPEPSTTARNADEPGVEQIPRSEIAFDEDDPRIEMKYAGGTVKGTAIDAITKEPVAGVIVGDDAVSRRRSSRRPGNSQMIPGSIPEVKTGADGRFSVKVPESVGPLVLSLSHDQYRTAYLSVGIQGDSSIEKVFLQRNPVLKGKVTVAPGLEVPAKISVRAEQKGLLGLTTTRRLNSVDKDEYRLTLPAGKWVVTAISSGGSQKLRSASRTIEMGMEDQSVDFELLTEAAAAKRDAAREASEDAADEEPKAK